MASRAAGGVPLSTAEVGVRSLLSLVVLLVVMVVVLVVSSRQAHQSTDAVRTVSIGLGEQIATVPFDQAQARRLVTRLSDLCTTEELPGEELRQAAATAAGWAAGLTPGSAEHHLAVKARGAAGELLSASTSLTDPHRNNARRLLAEAVAPAGRPGGNIPGAVGGLRDQIENLQNSEREKLQEVEKQSP